jgi:hypothetical protein
MLLPIALEGAPKQVTVTINSEPDSASVYAVMSDSAGQLRLVGYAPVGLRYETPAPFRKGQSCMTTGEIRVRWASGVSVTRPLSICPKFGKNQVTTFTRPDGPGLAVDLNVATQAAQLRAAVAAEAVANAAAKAQRQREWGDLMHALFPPPPPTIHCTSTSLGWSVETTCQ